MKNGKRKKRRRIAALLVLLLAFVSLALWLAESKIRPTVAAIAESSAKNIAVEAVNDAVRQALIEDGATYDSLVSITRNSEGKVTSVTVDSVRLNGICSDIRSLVTDYFNSLSEKTVSVPIGTLTGVDFFSGKGPALRFSVTFSGSSNTKIVNDFENAGINQTRHQMILEVDTKIYVIMKSGNFSTETHSSVVIAETVIVGDVPEIYSDGTNELWQNLVGYGE